MQGMELIYLTDTEKEVLFTLQNEKNIAELRESYADKDYLVNAACKYFEEIGFIYANTVSGGKVVDAMLKDKGKAYLHEFPELNNPIPKDKQVRFSRTMSLLAIALSFGAFALSLIAFFRA